MQTWGAWRSHIDAALDRPLHHFDVDASDVPHPRDAGFRRSIGLAVGVRHWRRALPCGRGAHVLEFRGGYTLHIDQVDPARNVLAHFVHDVLHVMAQGLTDREAMLDRTAASRIRRSSQ